MVKSMVEPILFTLDRFHLHFTKCHTNFYTKKLEGGSELASIPMMRLFILLPNNGEFMTTILWGIYMFFQL